MKMNEVDIHADDYGYSLHTSEDMLECMKQGKLDSISIICNTTYFERSMDLLKKTIPFLPFLPKMSIHLNLPEGDSFNKALPLSWGKLFLSSYSFSRNKIKKDIKEELKHQIEKCQPAIDECIAIAKQNGIRTSQKVMRLDSHVHTHLVPVVWDALTQLIEEENYEVEYIRNPKEPLMPFLMQPALWSSFGLANIIKNRILMFYSGKVDRYCDKHGMNKMYMWGLMMSGHMDLHRIEKIYPAMKRKAEEKGRTLEILFHPGTALNEEYSDEMNPEFFKDFNSSSNRGIEKKALMCIEEIKDQ